MSKAKYFVYRNLHKPGYFSIKYKGKVIEHCNCMTNQGERVEFRVRLTGLKQARKTKQRNVHAFVVMDERPYKVYGIDMEQDRSRGRFAEITYNPFKHTSFVWKDTQEPVSLFDGIIHFHGGKVYGEVK